VSDVNGLCIDAPNNVPDQEVLQVYGCHSGPNQRFKVTFWPSQPTLFQSVRRLSPLSGPNDCVSVQGWNRNAVEPIEQRLCDGTNSDYDQEWQFIAAQ